MLELALRMTEAYIALLDSHEQTIQQLQADKERLDWLDGPNWWDFCRAGNPRDPKKDFHIDIGEGEHCETYSESSARLAIDAARGVQLAKEGTDAVAKD